MLVLGHRGYAAAVTENTVAGVRAALDAGADGVEVDVRRTADGLLVLSHDPSYARSGGPDTPIVAMTGADLAGVTLAGGHPVALVADALDAAAGARVVLEVKNLPGEPDFDAPEERTARLLLDLLAERDTTGVVVSSFDWFAIEAVRGRVPTGFLTPPGLAASANLAYVVENGHAEAHPHFSAVLSEPETVEAAHAAGVRVVCWTVDDPDAARRLAELGVDGVISNDPAVIRTALGR